MADKKISALADAGAFSDTDLFAVVQGSSTLKMTGAQLRAAFFKSPMTAAGDLIVGGTAGAPQRLAKGADGKILGVVGGILTWIDPPSGGGSGDGLINPMTAEGEMIIGGTNGAAIKLIAGANGRYLQMVAGRPAWVVLNILNNPMTDPGDLIIGGTAGAPTKLTKGTDGQVLTLVGGVPVWAVANGATLSKVVTNTTTGYEMTNSDDNNTFFIMTNNNSPVFNFYRDDVSVNQGKPAWPDGAEVTVMQGGDTPIEFGGTSDVTRVYPVGKQGFTSKRGAVVNWKRTGVSTWTASGDLADAWSTSAATALTLTNAHNGQRIRFSSATAVTVTLQDNTFQRWKNGMEIELIQDGAGQITLSAAGITINRNPNATALATAFQNGRLRLRCVNAASNIWDLTGDLPIPAGGGASNSLPAVAITSQTSDYTLALADAGTEVQQASTVSSSNRTFTVPNNTTVAFPIGTEIRIRARGKTAAQITKASGVSLLAAGVYIANDTFSIKLYGLVTLKKVDTNTWMASGDILGGEQTVLSSAATELDATLAGMYMRCNRTSAMVITVPPDTTVKWRDSEEMTFEQANTGSVTFAAGSGVTINKMATNSLAIAGQFGVVTLKKVGTNTWTLFGALGAA
jgi:hypothetical protein